MKILIAEDDVHFTRSLEGLLRLWGYEPVVVHDGAAALQVLHSADAPRLVLLDWSMPGPDGVEVCRAVRARAGGVYTYIVLLTGRGGRDALLQAMAAGADEYLVKPADPDELRARLDAGRRIVCLQEQLLAAQEALRRQATRDDLTGLWNRAAVLEALDREAARARRGAGPVGVVLADVDLFKRVNDTHGHLTGDDVLREAARRLQAELRPYDAAGRYGGEEFLLVLPGCDLAAATALAERVRRAVGSGPVATPAGPVVVTLSLGVAAGAGGETEARALLRDADAALYRAKAAGRDRTEVAADAATSAAG